MGERELTGAEERIAGGFDRVSRDIFRVGRGQQALFALFDAFAKVVLTCVPEPPPDARPQAIARAKERYDRLVKSAGQNMSGDARAAMKDLVDHGDELTTRGIPAPAAKAARCPERRRRVVERIQASHALCPQQPKNKQPRARRKRERPASVPPALRGPGDLSEEQDSRAMESTRALSGARERYVRQRREGGRI